ncbi:MAG TPA: class I SAM-dependent methyltransferase [Firmicutes bacterium]|uniref:Methyltransferase type 11 domain-containing protein n=1 Tax=candidate division TA06 bacterium TaxID=2250710 RepID=A0A660S7B5_UNCT6|nr:MAG: hypothetical protein DRP44_05085 [candidate division TA06 bacterium]HFD05274.1 class I SAM-dependent methyltransferase [Bacillota bacterium]
MIYFSMDIEKYYLHDNLNYNYFESLSPSQFEEERRRNQLILKFAKLTRDKTIIDIGTGPGWLPRLASKYTKNVYSVDLSDRQLKLAEKYIGKANFTFRKGSFYKIPTRDSSFDVVVASEVLEHLETPKKALKEAHRILKDDGTLIITVPYKEKIKYVTCMHCYKLTSVNGHLHSFDIRSLRKLLHDSGFYIVRYKLFNSKFTSLLGLNRFLHFLPLSAWLFIDKICGKHNKILIEAKII